MSKLKSPNAYLLDQLRSRCQLIANECRISMVHSARGNWIELHVGRYTPPGPNGKGGIPIEIFNIDRSGRFIENIHTFLLGYRAGLSVLNMRPWAEGLNG